jgi:hypothetical protein
MFHIVTKVERQLKRKGHVQPTFNSGFLSFWKLNLRRDGAAQPKHYVPTKVEPPKAKVEASTGFKGKSNTQPKCTYDVKWFRCQGLKHYALECSNKRIVVTRGNGDVESESHKSYYEDMPPLEDCTEDELGLPIAESLVIRHILQV